MSDLLVFVDGVQAGDITTGGGIVRFEYAPEYLRRGRSTPLSLSLPRVGGRQPVAAWLDGLLPDNDEIRREWARQNNLSNTRPATLLGTPIGLDCAGAVQFCRPENESQMHRGGGLEPQSHADIAAWIQRARTSWPGSGRLGTHGQYSLGGAQAKYALHREGDQWSVPYGDTPTTHIIKPGIVGFDEVDVVEHVCMAAASLVGLSAARTELLRFEGERVLAVERFDRARPDDRLVRLHHEDVCQALGLPPDSKYQTDGGPSPRDISDLLREKLPNSTEDRRRFRDALLYNWAIAGTDAHAKNYSLLLHRGDVRLAPLYDVISFLPFSREPHWRIPMAMKVGSGYRLRKSDRPSAWENLADTLGLDPEETVARAHEMLFAVPDAISAAIGGLDSADQASPVVRRLDKRVRGRCKEVRSAFAKSSERGEFSLSLKTSVSSSANSLSRVSVCQQPLADRRGQCKRRLTTVPCPFHPHSPGSTAIHQRRG